MYLKYMNAPCTPVWLVEVDHFAVPQFSYLQEKAEHRPPLKVWISTHHHL